MSYILESYLNEINDEIITEGIIDNFKNVKMKIINAVKSKDEKKLQAIAKVLPTKEPNKINKMAYKKMPELKSLHKTDLRKFKIKDPDGLESSLVLGYSMLRKIHDETKDEPTKQKFADVLEKYGTLLLQIAGRGFMAASIMLAITIVTAVLAVLVVYRGNLGAGAMAVGAGMGSAQGYVTGLMFRISFYLALLGALLKTVGWVTNKVTGNK